MLGVCQRVAAIPMKRAAPAETRYLERDEIEGLLRRTCRARVASPCGTAPCCSSSTTPGRGCKRSPTYVSAISISASPAGSPPWQGRQVADLPAVAPDRVVARRAARRVERAPLAMETPVFTSATGEALTRFGIYKIVRRHAAHLDDART